MGEICPLFLIPVSSFNNCIRGQIVVPVGPRVHKLHFKYD